MVDRLRVYRELGLSWDAGLYLQNILLKANGIALDLKFIYEGDSQGLKIIYLSLQNIRNLSLTISSDEEIDERQEYLEGSRGIIALSLGEPLYMKPLEVAGNELELSCLYKNISFTLKE